LESKTLATISKEAVRAAFDVAKRIREGELTAPQGLMILEKEYGFNKNSAETYIHDYDCMIKGQLFTRTLNAYATEYYLTRLFADGGQDTLRRALSALRQHIDYYESTSDTKLHKVRSIYNQFVDVARTTPRQFLQYWKPKQVDREIVIGHTLDHSGSEQLNKAAPGNIIWIVTVRQGQITLVGRLVVGEIIDYREAKNRFGSDVWAASHHAVAKRGTEEPINELSLMPIAESLRFVSSTHRDRLDIEVGKVDGKQLQAIRELTPQSARLIERLWNGVGQATDFEKQVRRGIGFGNPETNKRVERAAIQQVTQDYVSRGWTVHSVEADKCGYDLNCKKGKDKEHVEVKGVQGQVISFIITRGERRRAQNDPNFVLCVVTSALTHKPTLCWYMPSEIERLFTYEPLAFQATLKSNREQWD
jgi:hypothetical protein